MLALVLVLQGNVARGRAETPPLQELAREVGAGQGVFARAADGTVLVSQSAARAVHPASVTKLATSLALIERLGADYRFETKLLASGPIRDGRLDGDLVIAAGRDPYLVSEGAYVILRRLAGIGLTAVEGQLHVQGPLLFNWQPDPRGVQLARALTGHLGDAGWPTVAALPPVTSVPLREIALTIAQRPTHRTTEPPTLLLTRHSPPLLVILKGLNEFSNNVFHPLSDQVGGPLAVEKMARAAVPAAFAPEIVITNGAGAGTENRLSPRAAVALLELLAHRLELLGHSLLDVLPVSGIDPGTLAERLLDRPGYLVGKTGTFGSVGASALSGVLRTKRYGVVTFAVLHHGIPVPEARARQDAFVRALITETDAEPWPYTTPARPSYTAPLDTP